MRGIVKTFPGVRALDGVDLEVRPGEVHCLLGQNGAGKSTLIKVLAGAHQPDEGEIRWQGEPVTLGQPGRRDAPASPRSTRSSTWSTGCPWPRTSSSATSLARRASSSAPRPARRARALLARLGHSEIRADREVGTLSAAGKQIVSMARALSHDARLIVMDEPSAVLDQRRGREPVPGHPRPHRRRASRSSTSRTGSRRSARSATGSPCSRTAARSPPACPPRPRRPPS